MAPIGSSAREAEAAGMGATTSEFSASTSGGSFSPAESDLDYTSCYCEENIRMLAERMAPSATARGQELYAVFLSNLEQKLELWHQKIGGAPDGYAIWDYHVVLLQCSGGSGVEPGQCNVWDFDTTLPFPSPLHSYARKALRNPRLLPRRFRVVPVEDFLRNFASDRSHMRDERGRFQAPPPLYPPIINADGNTMTLEAFLDMRKSTNAGNGDGSGFGVVLEEREFLRRFGVCL